MKELHPIPPSPGDRLYSKPGKDEPTEVYIKASEGDVTLIVSQEAHQELERLVAAGSQSDDWPVRWPVDTNGGPRLMFLTKPVAAGVLGALGKQEP